MGAKNDRHARTARLLFFYGPMDCGKSTLALQMNFGNAEAGRLGRLMVRHDRSRGLGISTRIGLSAPAVDIPDGRSIESTLGSVLELDYIIIDEAQFLEPSQVDEIAVLVDARGIDVYCFGLATDFQGRLFEGAARLFALADEALRVQGEKLCWCGKPGLMNGRVINGALAKAGDQVLIGDVSRAGPVHYEVLCREHYMRGQIRV